MSNDDIEFMPNQIECQIDLLARDQEGRVHAFSDARLISDLYQAHTENHAIVESVWQRLSMQVESTRPLAALRNEANAFPQQQERPQDMEITVINRRSPRLRKRFLEACAAILIVAALLAGTIFVLINAHQTPTATPTVATSSGLYVKTPDGVSRRDLASGKVLWNYRTSQQEPVVSRVYVMDNVVVFQKNASSGNLVGIDASTGKQLWSRTITQSSSIETAGDGAIIVSTFFGSRSGGTRNPWVSTITAYQATTGQPLWSHQLAPPANPQALSSVEYRYILAHGMLYLSSTAVTLQPSIEDIQIRALLISSGKSLWQKTIGSNVVPWAGADGNRLYLVVGKMRDGMQRYECFALNNANGNQVWQKELAGDAGSMSDVGFSPTVANGVLYIGSLEHSLTTDISVPHIYAYNASNGTLLKNYTLDAQDGFNFPPLVVQNLILYDRSAGSGGYPYNQDLVALDIQTGKPAWLVYVGPTSTLEPQIVNDIIYAPGGNKLFAYTTSGKLLHSYQAQATADASWDFTVVA